MKFKSIDKTYLTIYCMDDYWYCLTEGYINYKEILKDEEEVNKLEEAIKTIQSFFNQLEEMGILEYV